jgi:hypothetical protein
VHSGIVVHGADDELARRVVGENVVTETRVFANSSRVKRAFAAYWRLISLQLQTETAD